MSKCPDGIIFIFEPKRTKVEIIQKELITCKNCKHRRDKDAELWCHKHWFFAADDYYCADAEEWEAKE